MHYSISNSVYKIIDTIHACIPLVSRDSPSQTVVQHETRSDAPIASRHPSLYQQVCDHSVAGQLQTEVRHKMCT